MSSDRWLIDGDCTKCRREKYCNKPCKKHTRRTKADIMNYIYEKTMLGVAMNITKK